MFATLKYGFVLMLLMHLVLRPFVEAEAVSNVVGLVGAVGGNLLKPVVCLEDAVVAILQDLLKALTLDELGNLLLSILGPQLAGINALLVNILSLLQTLV